MRQAELAAAQETASASVSKLQAQLDDLAGRHQSDREQAQEAQRLHAAKSDTAVAQLQSDLKACQADLAASQASLHSRLEDAARLEAARAAAEERVAAAQAALLAAREDAEHRRHEDQKRFATERETSDAASQKQLDLLRYVRQISGFWFPAGGVALIGTWCAAVMPRWRWKSSWKHRRRAARSWMLTWHAR